MCTSEFTTRPASRYNPTDNHAPGNHVKLPFPLSVLTLLPTSSIPMSEHIVQYSLKATKPFEKFPFLSPPQSESRPFVPGDNDHLSHI